MNTAVNFQTQVLEEMLPVDEIATVFALVTTSYSHMIAFVQK